MDRFVRLIPRVTSSMAVLALSVGFASAAAETKTDTRPHWIQGPTTAPLNAQAEIKLPAGYAFANAEDTRRWMASLGNRVDNTEVGLVRPTEKGQTWVLVFEYKDVGYIKDDEKDKIDADALLDSLRRGTEEANKRRKEMGVPGLHVVGWQEKPHYDALTHNLQWAVLGRDDRGEDVVNYNVRLLGRGGYMSITLIDDPSALVRSKPQMEAVLAGFQYKQGSRYAEFRRGDKVAAYGLAALVAGGAGAAAVKFGFFPFIAKFLAKLGKGIVVVIVGIGAAIKKFFMKITGRSEERPSL